MDTTPIYTELRNTLADPEDRDWGPSAPPEFALALLNRVDRSERAARADRETAEPATSTTRTGTLTRTRRHRAED